MVGRVQTSIKTAIGPTQTLFTIGSGSTTEIADDAAQNALLVSGLFGLASPVPIIAVLTTSQAAVITGVAHFAEDYRNQQYLSAFGDGVEVLGDELEFAGTIAKVVPGVGEVVGEAIEAIGEGVDLLGKGITDISLISLNYNVLQGDIQSTREYLQNITHQAMNYMGDLSNSVPSVAGTTVDIDNMMSDLQIYSNKLLNNQIINGDQDDLVSVFAQSEDDALSSYKSLNVSAPDTQVTVDDDNTTINAGSEAYVGTASGSADDNSSTYTVSTNGSSITTAISGDGVKQDNERSDGTSQITIFRNNGSSTSTVYSGGGGTGLTTQKDNENADGTSEITIFSPDGTSKDTTYSGPNGTGTPNREDVEHPDGTSTVTVIYDSDRDGYISVKADYSGPHGTGQSSDVLIKIGHDNDILDQNGSVIVLPDGSYEHTIAIDVTISLPTLDVVLPPVRDPESVRKTSLDISSIVFSSPTYSDGDINHISDLQLSINEEDYNPDPTSEFYAYAKSDITAGNTSAQVEVDTNLLAGNNDVPQTLLARLDGSSGLEIPVRVKGVVYNSAVANVTTLTGERAIYLHVGDPEQITLLVNNANGVNGGDSLRVGTLTDPFVKSIGPLDVQAGQSGSLTLTIDTSSTDGETSGGGDLGVYTNYLNFISHDPDLPDGPAQDYGVYGDVEIWLNNYANPSFAYAYDGAFSDVNKIDDTHAVFDFGQVVQGGDAKSATFYLSNLMSSQFTDHMRGAISVTGSGFLGNVTLNPNDGIDITTDEVLGDITPDTSVVGSHEEIIVFHPTDFNSHGFSKTLPDQYLILRDNVIAKPQVEISITASADIPIVSATGPSGGVETFTATAYDSLFGNLPVGFREILSDDSKVIVYSGDTFSLGRHTIVGVAADPSGGSASSAPFTFVVVDQTPPIVTASANSANVLASSQAGGVETFTASASDAVDGLNDLIVFSEELADNGTKVVHSGDVFATGTHTIIASATDAAGNTGQAAPFTFTVASAEVQGVAIGNVAAMLSDQVGVAVAPFSGAVVSEPNDMETEALTVTLSNAASGIFNNLGGGAFDATTGIYTVAGSAADVTAALAGLLYTPSEDSITSTDLTVKVADTANATTSAVTSVVVGQTLLGTPDADTLSGQTGNDSITGLAGNDVLYGGSGADRLFGNLGNDQLFGGTGNDKLYGGLGDDLIQGNVGDDNLFGNLGNDRLVGGQGNDNLFGGFGNDQVIGGPGDDFLAGNAGNDRLVGGDGSDLLNGGSGNDVLIGGTGNDRFIFSGGFGHDRILDFSATEGDVIKFRAVAGITSFADLGSKFTQVGTDALITIDANNTILLKQMDASTLVAGDFRFS